jgi:Uncharacterized protein conserved in bacteria (DUF2066)
MVDGFKFRSIWLALLLGCLLCATARAAGPVETSVFAVQGVATDVTDKDAASAKDKALVDVQMKAIVLLAQKLGNEEMAAEIAKMEPKQVMPLLKSLSIEQENTAPGRYIGTFTVRFQPKKIKGLFSSYGVQVSGEQAEPILLIPLWKTSNGLTLWEDNVWLKAWRDLKLEQDVVPIIIPLGDAEDTSTLTPEDVAKLDAVKLEALRRRYDVKTMLVATAEAVEGNGIHATMEGSSPLGKITFDKVYTAEQGTIEASAALAATRFHQVMVEKYKSDRQKQVAAQRQADANKSHSIPVAVPFAGPQDWNGLRARILSTPGVIGVDVSTLAADGAVIRLMYVGDIESMQNSIQATGLTLSQVGGTWVIQGL